MLSEAFQGRILAMISKLVAPRRILELGTFTGYSALCLAEGLSEGGELITVDKNEELEDMACSFFGRSPYRGMIKMVIGDAMDVVPSLEGQFDIVCAPRWSAAAVFCYRTTYCGTVRLSNPWTRRTRTRMS